MEKQTMVNRHQITRDAILPMEEYGKLRRDRRAQMAELKRHRRVEVGPFVCFYFENYDTMLHQVHEMLYIERGGEAQIADELEAYNTLVPDGSELVATMMFEIADKDRRERELARLGHAEETVTLNIDGEEIKANLESDQERTTEDGKTSAVHFLHFPLSAKQIEAFKKPGAKAILSLSHANYAHMALIPEPVRAVLAKDFD
jgi:hypothetical protein